MNGKNMLIGLSYIDRKFVEESETDTVTGRKLHKMPRQEANISIKRIMKRPFLIAAILALMLFLMGCAVVMLHLNDLKIGEETYTQHPLYLEDGTKIPATEKVREIISLQGVADSPNQQAAKEWYDFTQSYDQDRALLGNSEGFPKPAAYQAYRVYTQEMVDKVDAICKKYGLKPAGEGAIMPACALDRMQEILGIDGILKKDAPAQARYSNGRFYECGNFTLDYWVTVAGKQEIPVGYYFADKDYFNTWYWSMEVSDCVQEWNYTTTDGTQLLLVKEDSVGHIFCDREDAFVHIALGGQLGALPDMTNEEMEAVAEVLDFTLKPGKVENMHALAAEMDELYELDELYRGALTPPDPEEEARQKAEFEAHERHDSFAELIADMRDNEDYFNRYSGDPRYGGETRLDFWETMEYCMMDANGDGAEDLILGRDGNICTIWTMKDGKTAALQGTWARGYLCEGNIFEWAVLEDGSHYHSYSNMKTGEHLGQVFYYPSDGVWHYQKGDDIKELTEAEAFDIMNSYVHVELAMKPVREFPMN